MTEAAGIRGYRPEDLDALYRISLATGDAGGDASALYRDPLLIGHIYVGPYAALCPEAALVAEDDGGAAGYVLGAVDARGFEARQEADWWPALRAAHPDPADIPPERRTADEQRRHRFHHPLRMPDAMLEAYPSHLPHQSAAAGAGPRRRPAVDRSLAGTGARGRVTRRTPRGERRQPARVRVLPSLRIP